MSKRFITKLSALFLVISLLCSPICTVFQTDSFAATQKQSEQYGVGTYTAQQKAFYNDLINKINEVIVNGGDVEGKLTGTSGDSGVRAVNDLIFDPKVYGITYRDMVQVYLNARLAHPEFFFISNTYLTWGTDKLGIAVIDSFTTRAERELMQEKISAELADYIAAAEGKRDIYSKVRAVHDLMVERIDYAYDANGQPESAYWAHSIVGAAVQKKGTCETFAKWFAYVLDALDIENMTVRGYSHNQPHAWNLVKMDDDRWYNIDVTWDDGSESAQFGIYYGYFANPSSDFNKDHTEDPETPEGTTCTYITPDAEDSYAFNPYSKDGLMLDYTDDSALWNEYIGTWAKALDKGEFTVTIYMGDSYGMERLRDISNKFTDTIKELREKGYSDILNGKATLKRSYLGEHLFKATINIDIPDPEAINVTFTAVNTVVNKGNQSMGADGFTVVLLGGEGEVLQSQKTDASGRASFTVSYTKDDIGKSYTYTVKIENEGVANVTYSSVTYTYVVTLTRSADNRIVAAITENGESITKAEAEFEQIYNYSVIPDPDPLKLTFTAVSRVENRGSESMGADGFTVIFLPEGEDEQSRKTDANGRASFTVSYTKDDIGKSYTYTLRIKNEGVANVTYSSVTYTYVVTLTLSADNMIVAQIRENGKAVSQASCEFENIYDYTYTPVKHDLDRNNVLDKEDARYILKAVLGYKGISSEGCDINGDMITDVRDAVMLLQIIKAAEA